MKKVLIPIAMIIVIIVVIIVVYLITTKSEQVENVPISSEYSTRQMKDAIKRNVPIIDIRRLDEWQRYGIIEGSHKITFFDGQGNVNIDKWMGDFKQIIQNKNQEFVLVCAHANRTKVVLEFLRKELGYLNAHDLQGGINYGWIDKGLKTVPN